MHQDYKGWLIRGVVLQLVDTGRPWHGLLEAYSVFPFWHARNGQKKGIQNIRYSESKFERMCLLLLKLGPAGLPDWTRYRDTHPCISSFA